MKNTVMIISDYDNIQAINLCLRKYISGVWHVRHGYKNRIKYCSLEFENEEDAVTFKMMFEGRNE